MLEVCVHANRQAHYSAGVTPPHTPRVRHELLEFGVGEAAARDERGIHLKDQLLRKQKGKTQLNVCPMYNESEL